MERTGSITGQPTGSITDAVTKTEGKMGLFIHKELLGE